MGGEEDAIDDNEELDPTDLIPGDNDKQELPHDYPLPVNPDAPGNLTIIPAYGGDVPNVVEPTRRGT